MSQPVNQNHQLGSAHSSSSNAVDSKGHSKASPSDHAMFLGMMSLIEGISESESIGVSLADMSKTLYDTMVKNGLNRIQDMQKELSALSYLQDNWAAFQAYTSWKDQLDQAHAVLNNPHSSWLDRMIAETEIKSLSGHPPALPTSDPSTIQNCVNYVNQFGTLSCYRSYVNGFSQQINTENNNVESNKQIPDSLQSQVRLMVNDQSQYASEVSSFLQVMQDQQQFS